MNGNVSKVIAATAAASLACEVVLGREVATDPAALFPVITHEAYLPETHDPEAPQSPRRPQREYPR